MKKSLKVMSSAFLAAALATGASHAFGEGAKFYVGGELGYNRLGYYDVVKQNMEKDKGTINKSISSGNILLGVKFNKNVAAELGYGLHSKIKVKYDGDNSKNNFNLKTRNLYIDAIGSMPVASIDENFSVLGSVGLGQFSYQSQSASDLDNNQKSDTSHKTGVRLGIGAEYKFNEAVATRVMLRHQRVGKTENTEILKNVNSVSAGLTYTF